jgi:hypothetical protein
MFAGRRYVTRWKETNSFGDKAINNIDGRDWEGNYTFSEQQFLRKITSTSAADGAWLVLAHDNHRRTVHGYAQFMIDKARENWYRDPMTGKAVLGLHSRDEI